MVDRIQVQDPNAGQARLDIAAQIVDPFFRPVAAPVAQPTASNAFLDLASALSDVSPQIRAIQDEQQAEFEQDEIDQALADRTRTQQSFADGVRNGSIPAGASPFYVKAYQGEDGRLTGTTQYRASLLEAISTSDIMTSDFEDEGQAAAALQAFVEGHRTDFLADNFSGATNEFILGFRSSAAGVEQQAAQQAVADRIAANEEKFLETTGNSVASILFDDTLTADQQVADIDAYAKQLSGEYGFSLTDFNTVVTEQLGNAALAYATLGTQDGFDKARETLALADKIPTGPGSFLAGRAETREAILKATGDIQQMEQDAVKWADYLDNRDYTLDVTRPFQQAQQSWFFENQTATREERERAEQDRDDEAVGRIDLRDGIARMLTDPSNSYGIVTEALQSENSYIADHVGVLSSFRTMMFSELNNPSIETNNDLLVNYTAQAHQGTLDPALITQAFSDRQISLQDTMRLLENAQQGDLNRDRRNSLPQSWNNVISDRERDISTLFSTTLRVSGDDAAFIAAGGDITAIGGVDANDLAFYIGVLDDLRTQVLDLNISNPDLADNQLRREVKTIYDGILERPDVRNFLSLDPTPEQQAVDTQAALDAANAANTPNIPTEAPGEDQPFNPYADDSMFTEEP